MSRYELCYIDDRKGPFFRKSLTIWIRGNTDEEAVVLSQRIWRTLPDKQTASGYRLVNASTNQVCFIESSASDLSRRKSAREFSESGPENALAGSLGHLALGRDFYVMKSRPRVSILRVGAGKRRLIDILVFKRAIPWRAPRRIGHDRRGLRTLVKVGADGEH